MIKFNERNFRVWSNLGAMGAFHAIGLMEAKKSDNDIVVMVADTYRAVGLDRYARSYPESFFNMGIAEQNLVGMSAGLSAEGENVFLSTYASFLTGRAYEFVRHNMGVEGHGVKLVGCFAGVQTGTSGYSHWSIDDISLMRNIPGMTVISPADGVEAVKTALAVSRMKTPVYVRFCGATGTPMVYSADYDFEVGKAVRLKSGSDIAIIATGLMVSTALEASEMLAEQGVSCSVFNFHTIKPLDGEVLCEIYQAHNMIVSLEEHSVIGGLGTAIAQHKTGYPDSPRQIIMGFDDCYRGTGSRDYVLQLYGLTSEDVARRIWDAWSAERTER